MNDLGYRLVGVAIVAVVVFLLDLNDPSALHALVLPLTLAIAAFLITRSLMAVALATLTLAAANSEIGSEDWIRGFAYPLIAATGGATCAWLAINRFRARIRDTHEHRWAKRK